MKLEINIYSLLAGRVLLTQQKLKKVMKDKKSREEKTSKLALQIVTRKTRLCFWTEKLPNSLLFFDTVVHSENCWKFHCERHSIMHHCLTSSGQSFTGNTKKRPKRSGASQSSRFKNIQLFDNFKESYSRLRKSLEVLCGSINESVQYFENLIQNAKAWKLKRLVLGSSQKSLSRKKKKNVLSIFTRNFGITRNWYQAKSLIWIKCFQKNIHCDVILSGKPSID